MIGKGNRGWRTAGKLGLICSNYQYSKLDMYVILAEGMKVEEGTTVIGVYRRKSVCIR